MFDIIGDVHGCYDELLALLAPLNWALDENGVFRNTVNPERTLVFCGDLGDRGPNSLGVFTAVRKSIEAGTAKCVRGNHENKAGKYFVKKNTKLRGGLETTVKEIEAAGWSEDEQTAFGQWCLSLPAWIKLELPDGSPLVVVHACLPFNLEDPKSEGKAIYGIPTGYDANGFPTRLDWAQKYRGKATVVHGHDVIGLEPRLLNKVWNLDTGGVFGGRLTCLQLPEEKIHQIDCQKYWEKGGKHEEA